ncbi:hypothetical protein CBL_09503 [Carabus blaptoides fortunei]
MGDECDWTGSASSTSTGRGVTPVYLRCSAGRVTWLYPRGALRVLLRLPSQDREFRACIKVHPQKGRVPARLFLEGPRSLLPVYADNDGGNKATRCFQSKHGQAAIYVEATDSDPVTRRVADFEYDLQPLPRGKAYDPAEECRPCTGEELAHAFCTSDLVTRGIIRSVENDYDRDISEMKIKITKLIRHTADDGDNNEIETNHVSQTDFREHHQEVSLQVPKHCGVSHGVGEFIFMARRKLGDLTLQCAPRLEDWAALVRSLTDEGKAHCVLRS